MNIAVNAQTLQKNRLEGLGWFAYETLKRITVQHPEHNFLFIFNNNYDKEFVFSDNITSIIVGPKYAHPFCWYLKFEYLLPRIMKKNGIDLYFSPDGWCSLNSKIRTYSVIHDLNFEHYPLNLPYTYREYYKYFFPKWIINSERIATVSEFTKNDIINKYNTSPQKIDVVYNGCNESFKPIDETKKIEIRNKFANGCQYFIFVGATPPRKNIINLFKAFDIFKTNNENKIKLVLAGTKKWWSEEIRLTYEKMKFKDEVIFTGRVSTDDLNGLISSSIALTYTSLFEGFGIPLLEAMNCETAIITSDCTSMPEISRDSALLVNPFSPEEISNAMAKILYDRNLRNNLIESGKIRRKDFSWDKTANLLWKSIEKVF